jgi:DNA-binding winged helix-turn-helix (wHTH) protein
MRVCFAGCRLDLAARRLFRAAHEVHLSPKAFALLQVLVEQRPRAVPKNELLDLVWPGTFVSEASLARVINEVREAIGDDAAAARVIRTVHGFGYAFAAEAVEEDVLTAIGPGRQPIGWLSSGAVEFPIWEGDQMAGRDATADLRLDSSKVSRQHARIGVRGAVVTVEDLQSKNGTYVRGVRISATTAIDAGDEVRIGPFALVFSRASSGAATETQFS